MAEPAKKNLEEPPPNAFDGLTFGQGVLKLKANPELASDFDAKFKDEEEFETLERARLHLNHSFYRGTTAGASWLQNAAEFKRQVTESGKEVPKSGLGKDAINPYANVPTMASPTGATPFIPTPKQMAEMYDLVVEDLANYERMKPAETWTETAAAIGGALAGAVPTPENLLSLPIRFVKPLAAKVGPVAANIIEGGAQAAVVNVAIDPVVQTMNMEAGVQKNYDWMQTALQAPLGFVIGGGLVGVGQVLTKRAARELTQELAVEDSGFRTVANLIEAEKPRAESPTDVGKAEREVAKRADDAVDEALPDEAAIQAVEQPKIEYAERNVVTMTPQQYLDLAVPFGHAGGPKMDEAKVAKLADLPEFETAPMLSVKEGPDGRLQVGIHDGRHRAAALAKRGEKTMQVEIVRGKKFAREHPDITDEMIARRISQEGLLPEILPEPTVRGLEAPERAATPTGGPRLRDEQQRPAAGVPAGPESVEVRSQQRMVQDLEKDFDVDIRQGRIRMKNALGTYNLRTGVIHAKQFSDFEVAVHETAHKIDREVPGLTALTQRWANELDQWDYAYHPILGGRTHEGFAEWMRFFIGNPVDATRKAPGFTAEFLNFLETNRPDYLKALINHAKNYQTYLTAPSVDVLRASTIQPETNWDRLGSALEQQQLPKTIHTMLAATYDTVWDRLGDVPRVMRAAAQDAAKRAGTPVQRPQGGADPEINMRRLHRTGQMVQEQITNGVYDYGGIRPTGPSLNDVLMAVHGAKNRMAPWKKELVDDFNVYLVGKQALVRWDQFSRGDLDNPPFSMSAADVAQAVADLDAQYPQFAHAAEIMQQFNRAYLKRFKDSGPLFLDDDAYNRMLQYPYYATMMRDVSDRPMIGGLASKDTESAAIKGFKGSMRDVLSPLDQTLLFMHRAERVMAQNEIHRLISRYFANLGEAGGKYVEPVKPYDVIPEIVNLTKAVDDTLRKHGVSQYDRDLMKATMVDISGTDPLMGTLFHSVQARPKGDPIKFYAEDSQLKAHRLISSREDLRFGLFEALDEMPKLQSDMVLKMFEAAAGVTTRFTVLEPTFAVLDFIRTQATVPFYIRGFWPGISTAIGVVREIRNDKFAQAYRAFGGVGTHQHFFGTEEGARAEINSLARQGYLTKSVTSWKGLGQFLTLLDQGARTEATAITYRQLKKQGLSDYDAIVGAVYQATDVYDMGRYGSHVQTAQRLTPFLRSALQGPEKALRAATPATRFLIDKYLRDGQVFDTDSRDAKNAAIYLGKLALTVPFGMTFAALMWDKEVYRDAKPDVMGRNFVLPIGPWVITIPKNFELSIPFTMGEYLYRKLFAEDPRAAEEFTEAAWKSIEPPIPILGNTLARVPLESATNTRLFDWGNLVDAAQGEGIPVVPERLKGIEATRQIIPGRTSPMAIKLGKAMGVSPIKVDHIVGGMFSTYGQHAQNLSKAIESDDEVGRLEDNAILRRWLKDPKVISGASKAYFDYMGHKTGKFAVAVNTYNHLLQNKNGPSEADAFLRELPDNAKVWVMLQRAGSEIDPDKLAFKPADRIVHPFARANAAVREMTKLEREVIANNVKDSETGKPLVISPATRTRAREILSQLTMIEFRNALAITKEPGWADRPLIDPTTYVEQLKVIAPGVAKEVVQRYANKKIFRTQDVAQVYDRLTQEVLTNGSSADLGAITDFARQGGYEFGGQRIITKPRRQTIKGTR